MLPTRTVEWQPLRDAFVLRPTRPTHAELAAEFQVPAGSITRCAAEEGWTSLRAQYLEKRLQESDAAAIMLEACQVDRAVVRAVRDLALVAFEKIKAAVESIEEDRAPATKLDALNTAGFAASNFCKALRECGVVGLPKELAGAGKEDNGRWNPKMLSQINLTVQNLVGQQAKDSPTPATQASAESVA